MRLIRHSSNLCKTTLSLYFLGDMHLGTLACDEDAIARTVQEIASTPHAYVIGMGDYAEFISCTDKRYNEQVIPARYWKALKEGRESLMNVQLNRVIELFTPIKDKILALQPGNHEDKFEITHHFPVTDTLARRLGVALGGWHTYYDLRFPKSYKRPRLAIIATHGVSMSNTMQQAMNTVQSMLLTFDADIFAQAHAHFSAVNTIGRYELRQNKVRQKQVLLVLSGGFTQGLITNKDVYTDKVRGLSRIIGCTKVEIKL